MGSTYPGPSFQKQVKTSQKPGYSLLNEHILKRLKQSGHSVVLLSEFHPLINMIIITVIKLNYFMCEEANFQKLNCLVMYFPTLRH